MKKIILGAIISVIFGSAAFAADYGAAGCGLGSLVFKENDMTQVLAATTNGTFGNQTFGLTFGTSNCTNKGLVKLAMVRESFIESNYKDLSRDAAAGKGEYVDNLAKLYGFSPETSVKFAMLLQSNYAAVFASNNAQNAVSEINKLLAAGNI
ncbi:MAG: hypothetical protein A2270_01345 [Elusimicrobia bacterium RIFOXYA12_FULL_51_18]|nr:MAG: hypothetical protein A2270_01345 [Elusimicrobia bacterium RIFOXYA12_FULL_51_18]OGS30024.1 MAG: hypothetical protein A2218_12800 [Elusimicrobia bacterium RIFOXYA2_FULL_53_38]